MIGDLLVLTYCLALDNSKPERFVLPYSSHKDMRCAILYSMACEAPFLRAS